MFKKKMFTISILTLIMLTAVILSSSAQVYTIATDPMGTGTYGATAGIAKIVNDYTKLNINVKPTTGGVENGPLMAFEEVEFIVLSTWDADKYWKVEERFAEPLQDFKVGPARMIMGGPPTHVSPVVREDAGIETGQDLKGKKYAAILTGSSSGTAQGMAALANWGLTEDDVIMITVSGLEGAIEALIDGRADAAGTSAPGQAILRELDAKRGARFLSLDFSPEALDRYRAVFPGAPITLYPSPDLAGVKGPTNMIYFEDFLVGHPDLVSDDVAYEMVKAVYEHFDELQELHASLARMNIEGMASLGAPAPYHPGVIKFYKEVGLWTDEHEALNQKLLAAEEQMENK